MLNEHKEEKKVNVCMYLCVSACLWDIVLVVYSALTTSSIVHSFLVFLDYFLLQSVLYNDTFSLA